MIGEGQGIHWSDLDEDLSVEGLIAGRPSRESQRSFKRWLEAKLAGRSVVQPLDVMEHIVDGP